jgi:hypothetical protein
MRIISDRRKNVSMEFRGKFGRNSECVLALVARTCKRSESSGVSLGKTAKLASGQRKTASAAYVSAPRAVSFAENVGDTQGSDCEMNRSPISRQVWPGVICG